MKYALRPCLFLVFAVAAFAQPITLLVDLTEAPRKIVHARLFLPAKPGPLTLVYPKWIPGWHMPVGPIVDLAGPSITAAGRPVAWKRDLVDMHAFHLTVPAEASSLEIQLDFLVAPRTEIEYGSSSTNLAILNWNAVLLYPQGSASDKVQFTAKLLLPVGWKYATALPAVKESGGTIDFQSASLTDLVDSPVLAGRYFRTIDLSPGVRPAHYLHIAADSADALEADPEVVGQYQQLVKEAGALFGAHHYREYHFLLALSDQLKFEGIEHHESSDNRDRERYLVDEQERRASVLRGHAELLSHEFVHSWNGKYRRPAGLATPDYQKPMTGDLLWVYEGLTQYLGWVLSARSGLLKSQQWRENLATQAAVLDHREGRRWRSLEDTAIAVQLTYSARPDWESLRRAADYYDESALIWLEADTIIRRQTQGKRSLDDFCRRFYGGSSGPPTVKPYTFDDVVDAMNATVRYDWNTFFESRLNATGKSAPLEGLVNAGWRLNYSEVIPDLQKAFEQIDKATDVNFSIGLTLREDGTIIDTLPQLAAAKAGVGPGMKLIAVNGRKWAPEVLRSAIKATKKSGPLDLLVQNDGFFSTFSLNYKEGERYPLLVRTGQPDVFAEICKPLAP